MSTKKQTPMCPNASVYFVAGLGGSNPLDFKVPFRQLVESVFGLQFDPQNKEVLPNQCKFAMKPDLLLIKRIKEIVYKQAFCDHVSLVWFAHSHGAKMICEAYKQLQGTPVFPKIKAASAIICIGGASLATEDLAKFVFNVEYKNDKIAKGGSNIIGDRNGQVLQIGPFKNGSCLCCDERTTYEPKLKQTNKSAKGFSHGISAGVQGSSASRSSASSNDEKAHYIGEYLECRMWRKTLQQMLPLQSRCAIHSK